MSAATSHSASDDVDEDDLRDDDDDDCATVSSVRLRSSAVRLLVSRTDAASPGRDREDGPGVVRSRRSTGDRTPTKETRGTATPVSRFLISEHSLPGSQCSHSTRSRDAMACTVLTHLDRT